MRVKALKKINKLVVHGNLLKGVSGGLNFKENNRLRLNLGF